MPSLSPYMPVQYIPERLRGFDMQYFAYSIVYKAGSAQSGGSNLLASAQKQAASVNVQADAFFLTIALAGVSAAVDDSTVDATPRVLIQLQDSGSGQAVSDQLLDWNTTVGTAANPFFLPYPRIFAPNATITTYATNLIATAKNIYLTLQGFKIYAPLSALSGN